MRNLAQIRYSFHVFHKLKLVHILVKMFVFQREFQEQEEIKEIWERLVKGFVHKITIKYYCVFKILSGSLCNHIRQF